MCFFLVQVTVPTPVAGARRHVIETVDGRGRIVARTEASAESGSGTVRAGPISTPHAEVRVHALDSQGQLLAQGAVRLRVRRRPRRDGWPIYFYNARFFLPQPLLVRRFDANGSLGVSAYMPVRVDRSPLGRDEVRAADRLDIPYAVQTSGWITPRGGTAPDRTPVPPPDPDDPNSQPLPNLSLTDVGRVAGGMSGDTTAGQRMADGNVLFYRVADDEPTPPYFDASHDPQALPCTSPPTPIGRSPASRTWSRALR